MKFNSLDVTISQVSPTSESAFDGQLTVKISGGKPTYFINVVSSTAFGNKTYKDKSNLTLTGLSKGEYFIIVTDIDNNKFYKAIKL